MPFHVAMFGPQPTPYGGLIYAQPSGDPLLGEYNQSYLLPSPLNRVMAASAYTDNGAHFQLRSQALDPDYWPWVIPENADGIIEPIPSLNTYFEEQFIIPPMGDLAAFYLNGIAANIGYVAVWLGDNEYIAKPPHKNIIRAYFTGQLPAQANGWSLTPITFQPYLAEADYAVIGGYVFNGAGIIFRLVPATPPLYRPGGLCRRVVHDFVPRWQRDGHLGEWLRFNSLLPPSVEIYFAAPTALPVTGVLDLIQLPLEAQSDGISQV